MALAGIDEPPDPKLIGICVIAAVLHSDELTNVLRFDLAREIAAFALRFRPLLGDGRRIDPSHGLLVPNIIGRRT